MNPERAVFPIGAVYDNVGTTMIVLFGYGLQ